VTTLYEVRGCRIIKQSILFLLLFLLPLITSHFSLLYAQTEAASVSGRVTDQSNAVVPDVEVEIKNVDTGLSQSTKTNGDGFYFFPNLKPGNYLINVRKPAFRTISLTGVTLHVQDEVSRNFALQVGSSAESVTVTADSLNINTTDASVSTVVDRQFVENTPLNGRSFQDLISMTPGVVTRNPSSGVSNGQAGDFSVNGQRTEANYYTVDGVSGNVSAGAGFGSFVGNNSAASGSLAAGTVLGTTQSLVSVDALQEFRVQSSTYSAEYGRAPGGQFSFVTRSGTNDLHGTLFDYFRNDVFDANDWFNDFLGKPISALRQNDFGGTLGGPIRVPHLYNGRDKTFFFFSYEGLRLVQPQAASTSLLVPDTFMRQQAPAALQPILNAFPLPNGKDFGTAAAPSLAQFIQPFSVLSNIDATSIRIDHTLGSKLSLFFRFADTPTSAQARGPAPATPSGLQSTSVDTQTYTLGAISQLSARANDDFRLGYARSDASVKGTVDSFGGAVPIDLPSAMGAVAAASPSPLFLISIPGVGLSALREFNAGNRLRQWNLTDTFTVALGRHQLKLGFDYRRIVSPNSPPFPAIQAQYTSAQSVLNNKAPAVLVQNNLSATPIFNETAAFAQDQWHVAPRLNISFGVRWEVDPPPHGANGQDAYTLLGSVGNPSSLTLAPRGTPLWHTTWYNFAPRLGAAWTARNNPRWETVIRAGGGVFFDTNNQTAAEGFSGLGFSVFGVYPGAPLPLTPAQLNITPSVTPPFASSVYLFPAHLQLPYTLQWNFAIQQAIGAKQSLSVSYVGAAARRMTGQQTLSLTKLNPIFGSGTVVYWTSNLTSDYDALQLQFQRSLSRGIHALASYTWSHCLDVGSSYSSSPTAPGINQNAFLRGNCEMDVRHNLQGGASWDLPVLSGNKFTQALANHWGLDGRLIARTGFPVPINGTFLIDPTTGAGYFPGVNLIPNQPIYVYGSQYPGGRSINPAAFASPAGNSLGNAPRNFVRAFGAWQINMAVRREFPIREKLHLQFRAEAFNILNHPNFGRIDPTRSSATFGQATAMLNQGLPTVASQYQQGGPRSIQFALKLVF